MQSYRRGGQGATEPWLTCVPLSSVKPTPPGSTTRAVLDVAAYADANNLWVRNQAKAYVTNGPVGVIGRSRELTSRMNLYRTDTGFVHGSPGTAP
jgi:hypothetical protein